jgi:hypothetical protein
LRALPYFLAGLLWICYGFASHLLVYCALAPAGPFLDRARQQPRNPRI